MFAGLGVLLIIYTLYAAWSGSVLAKDRAWMQRIDREQSPRYFWAVIFIYTGLSAALIWVF